MVMGCTNNMLQNFTTCHTCTGGCFGWGLLINDAIAGGGGWDKPKYWQFQAVKGLQLWSKVQHMMFCGEINYVASYARNERGGVAKM